MNAYRAYEVIEERKWAEQTLTEEKEKWIDDRAKEVFDSLPEDPYAAPCRKSRQACSASLYRWTKAHTKASAAIPPERHITISFRQLLTPRRNTTGITAPAARFNFGE